MSPPPTSIDGTDITGATIDGQEVQEITIDGQTVFSPVSEPTALGNLVAWYPFDSSQYGGANADDVTAIIGGSGDDTGYDGTEVNNPTYQTSGGADDINAGPSSGYYDFSGNDHIETRNDNYGNVLGGKHTVTFWARGDVPNGAIYLGIDEGSSSMQLQIRNQLYKIQDNSNTSSSLNFSTTPTANSWTHYAFKSDNNPTSGDDLKAFVNGTDESFNIQDQGAMTNVGSFSNPIVFGGFFNRGTIEQQAIELDDIRFYDTNLSASEINQIVSNTDPN